MNAATRARADAGPAHRTTMDFAPLGIALRVDADCVALVDAVAAMCLGCEAPIGPDTPRLHLRLRLGPVAVGDGEPAIRIDGARLSIRGDGVDAGADARQGRAWCRVGDARRFGDPGFRERVLDTLILWMITRCDRTPVHASAFVAGGIGVMLAGRSGSGKSCLAWAAHAAGYALLSDDTVYVETRSRFRLWGIPRAIHLFPEDAPERADAPIRLRNGKRKRAIALPVARRAVASRAVLCVLARGERVALDPLDPDAAIAVIGAPEPGFDLLEAEAAAAIRHITRKGAWRLTLGADPHAAIRLLAANLPRLEERTAS